MRKKIPTELKFLAWALALNFLLFIPHYLWHMAEGGLWPFPLPQQEQSRFYEFLFLSDNHNPFRIAGEFLVLSLLVWLGRKQARWIRWPFLLTYWFYFAYQTYFAFYQKVYGVTPSFLDDWLFIRDVLPIFFSTLEINNLGNLLIGSIILFVLFVVILWLANQYFNQLIQFDQITHYPKTLILLLCFVGFGTYQYQYLELRNPNRRVQWVTPRVVSSAQVDYHLETSYANVQRAYGQYFECPLAERKNIYHIFLESYGCVAYTSNRFGERMKEVATRVGNDLAEAGWFTSSAYSVAPIKGGRSWLSFTSGLTGIKLDRQYNYDSLLNVNYRYPHITAFMNDQGYSTHRISTFRTNQQTDSLLSLEELNAFWQFDNAAFYDAFPYQGYLYDGLGGIPDQYAMGYFQDSILPTFPGPHYLFFITTTSHAGFCPPPPVVTNWQELDQILDSPTGFPWWVNKKSYSERYPDAITYNLEFWLHFITKYGTENDIFIITGDHQPPGLEYQVPSSFNDAAVPFHVIAKDENFTRSFLSHELQNRFLPDDSIAPVMRHEGMYSLLLHHLFKVYGTQGCSIPPYLPDGITQDDF